MLEKTASQNLKIYLFTFSQIQKNTLIFNQKIIFYEI